MVTKEVSVERILCREVVEASLTLEILFLKRWDQFL